MKNEITRLPESELDIMLVLWSADAPVKASEILAALTETHSWKKATLHVLLDRLYERGFVIVSREHNYKLFSPKISEETYRQAESRTFMNKLCRGSWTTLVSAFASGYKLTEEDISEIEALLRNKRGEH